MNLPLQARTGLNVGNEPSLGNFIDKAGQSRVTMSGNNEVTLLEGIQENGRAVLPIFSQGTPAFPAFHSDPAAVGYETFYYNTFGEKILTTPVGVLAPSPDVKAVELVGMGVSMPILMVPGEKITMRRAVSGPAPGTADVTVFPHFRDFKIKPKPVGGGGLSDGNVARVRATITSQGVEVQPPAGKAWNPVRYSEEAAGFDLVGHFGAVGDNPAVVEVYLVDEDNVARLIGTSSPIAPQTFAVVNEIWEFETVLAHPRKLRFKLVPSEKLPIPTGRVLLMSAYTEFDLPK